MLHLQSRKSVRESVAKAVFISLIVLGFIHLFLFIQMLTSFYQVRYVATDSMEPWVPRGTVVVLAVGGRPIEVGSIVMYHYEEVPGKELLHRVIAVNNGVFYIKGDARKEVDTVKPDEIDGVMEGAIPLVGTLRWAIRADPLFAAILLSGIASTAVLIELGEHPLNIERGTVRGGENDED